MPNYRYLQNNPANNPGNASYVKYGRGDRMYSEDVYQKYMDDNDFRGAALYLSQYEMNDPYTQSVHLNKIHELEREEYKWTQYGDERNNPAVTFTSNFDKGRVQSFKDGTTVNEYSAKYEKDFINFGNVDGKEASAYSITFQRESSLSDKIINFFKDLLPFGDHTDEDDAYELFKYQMGATDFDLAQMGIRTRKGKGGNTEIYFNKDNKYINDIFKALGYVNSNNRLGKNGQAGMYSGNGEASFIFPVNNIAGNIIKGIAKGIAAVNPMINNSVVAVGELYGGTMLANITGERQDLRYSISSVDKNGYELGDVTDDFLNMMQTYKDAYDEVNDIRKRQNAKFDDESELETSTIITQFVSYGHMEVDEMARDGRIGSTEEYNRRVEIEKNNIYRILSNTDITRGPVLASVTYPAQGEQEVSNVMQECDQREKSTLAPIIRQAIQDGRLNLTTAYNGGIFGYYMTISPKSRTTTEKETMQQYILHDGNGKKIYGNDHSGVLNIFLSSDEISSMSQEVLMANSEYKSMIELDRMRRGHYSYNLAQGGVIEPYSANDIIFLDTDGTRRSISIEEARKKINRSIISTGAATKIYGDFNKGLIKQSQIEPAISQIALQSLLEEDKDVASHIYNFTTDGSNDVNKIDRNMLPDYAKEIYGSIYNYIVQYVNDMYRTR